MKLFKIVHFIDNFSHCCEFGLGIKTKCNYENFEFQGSRFALMEVKAVFYYILLNFKIEPNSKSQIPLKLKKKPVGMVTERGIHISLKPRN